MTADELIALNEQIAGMAQAGLPGIPESVLKLGRHPIPPVAVPVGIVALVFLAWLLPGLTDRGRVAWARVVYAVPAVGTLIRSARLAAFAELMAVLVEFEVPL